MKIAIIIPTYNERENIKKLISEIFKVSKKNKLNTEALIVDDNSPDGTANVVKGLMKKYPIRLIQRSCKLGLGSAYVTGFKETLKTDIDVVFQMDGDLSHSPEYLPNFVEKINRGFHVVIGSRKIKGGGTEDWGIHRKIVSWGGNFIGRIMAGINVKDITSGYRAYKKEALQNIGLDEIKSDGYAFQLELLHKILKRNFKVVEVPIVFKDRKIGKSKLSKREIIKFFILALKLRLGLV